MNKILGIKERVEKFLKKDIRCRDDDKWLIYCVTQDIANENGESIFIPFDLFKKLPPFESISRCRRKFQEEGEYPASKDVKENRTVCEEEIKEELRNW